MTIFPKNALRQIIVVPDLRGEYENFNADVSEDSYALNAITVTIFL